MTPGTASATKADEIFVQSGLRQIDPPGVNGLAGPS